MCCQSLPLYSQPKKTVKENCERVSSKISNTNYHSKSLFYVSRHKYFMYDNIIKVSIPHTNHNNLHFNYKKVMVQRVVFTPTNQFVGQDMDFNHSLILQTSHNYCQAFP